MRSGSHMPGAVLGLGGTKRNRHKSHLKTHSLDNGSVWRWKSQWFSREGPSPVLPHRVCHNHYCFQFPLLLPVVASAAAVTSVVSDSVRPRRRQPTRLLCPWDSPGKNTGMGCYALLQGIFPTQGSNPGLWHCRQILYCLSHQGSPKILEWVAYYFSRGSWLNTKGKKRNSY